MSLNIGVADVELLNDNQLRVTVGVSVTGFTPSESYTGQVSVANSPSSDFAEIEGTVGTGAGEQHVVTLDAGLTDDDLPTEVLITAALNDGTQEQVTVEVSPGGGGTGGGDDPDSIGAARVAKFGAGGLAIALAARKLL